VSRFHFAQETEGPLLDFGLAAAQCFGHGGGSVSGLPTRTEGKWASFTRSVRSWRAYCGSDLVLVRRLGGSTRGTERRLGYREMGKNRFAGEVGLTAAEHCGGVLRTSPESPFYRRGGVETQRSGEGASSGTKVRQSWY
jgi:hypothetical protein